MLPNLPDADKDYAEGYMTQEGRLLSVATTRIAGLLLTWIFCTLSVAAQEGLSTLRGTVTDATGAVVAGADVTALAVLTNITARTATTDAQGNFEMPALKAGQYRVSAVARGFKKGVVDDVTLQSNDVRRVNIALQVGEVVSEITVSGAAAAIQTEEGKIGADFNAAKNYGDLPIPGNAFSGTYAVLSVLPDVQRQPGDWGSPTFAGQGGSQVHMAQDGVKEETLNSQTVNMEAVSEVKAVFVNNTADYARVGYFDTITKSGTNEYHAEASYYHRNSALGARNFFEDQKTKIIYHTFNLSAGGPIIKNKTFFYALWNGERVPGSFFYLRTVPTAKMRNGDFSELLSLDDPVIIKDPLTGKPFEGNVIPGNRITNVAQKVQEQFFPAPNRGGPGALANNLGFVHPYPDDQFYADVFSVRVDHHLSNRNSLYGRIQTYFPQYVLAGAYPATRSTQTRPNYSWVFTDTHVFSSRLVNTFSTGGNRDGIHDNLEVDGFQPPSGSTIVQNLGLQGVNQAGVEGPGGSPVFRITGYSDVSVPPGGFRLVDRNFNFADSLTWDVGQHIIKFGGELRTYRDFTDEVPNDNFGRFQFNGSFSGNAYGDFLLGLPRSSTRLNPIVNRTRTSKELGLFITDSYKVSSRLTVDYGLRWDRFSATTYADGLMFNWDPATGNVVVSDQALPKVSAYYPANIRIVSGNVVPKPDNKNFVPRVGVAYRLNDKTVLRGGYGIFNEFLGKYTRVQGGGPFAVTETYFNNVTGGVPLFQMPNPFPSTGVSPNVPSQSVSGYPTQTKNGRIHQFNVTVEKQVGDLGFRASYIGSRNLGMNYSLSTNKPRPSLIPFSDDRRPYTQFVNTTEYRSDGRSNYDSLSIAGNRRVGTIMFDAHWTWAHGKSDYLNLENPYSPKVWNRTFLANHRVVFNTIWEVPVGRDRRFLSNAPGVVENALGGWRLVWVAYLQTGQRFSPEFSDGDPSNTNTFGGLPDRVCDGNLPAGQRTIERWFDTSCFVTPAAGRFGNSGVNVLEGPGLQVHNLSVVKKFRLTDKLSFDYMALISNIFNHPNFLFPAADISVPGEAGVIGETHGLYSGERAGPRMIEMRVRFRF
jgi:carboxypeptidase family protein/TonB-dependent receptor-like protein